MTENLVARLTENIARITENGSFATNYYQRTIIYYD